MKCYVLFNPDGTVQQCYMANMHQIPTDAESVSKEEFDKYCTRQYQRGADGRPGKIIIEGPTLDERKNNLRTAINAERDRREQGGFEHQNVRFDSDSTSVIRINAAVNTAVSAILNQTDFAVNWTAADNTTAPLDAQGLLGLSVALAQHSNTQHVRARALKDQLDNADTAETVAEVENLLEEWKQEP